MKLTKEYITNCIEEVAPLVEEISGLECDLTDLNLIILPKNKLKKITPGVASYRSKNNFAIGNRFLGNEEFTKLLLGHELVHSAQDNSFPEFCNTLEVVNRIWKENHSTVSSLTKLIEGDASLIEQELSDKYFKNAKMNLLRFPLIPSSWVIPSDYFSWEETLRKKFNGNRRDINELYTAPIEELVKIFGE